MAEDKDKGAEFIAPPTTLKDKVGDTPLSTEDLKAIERAQAVIAKLAERYVEVADADLSKLQAAAAAFQSDPANRARHLERLFQIGHDMKGQGGSFGYPLITTIANQLCRFIERLGDDIGNNEAAVVMLHVDALKVVISSKMKDADASEAKALLKGLEMVITKVGR